MFCQVAWKAMMCWESFNLSVTVSGSQGMLLLRRITWNSRPSRDFPDELTRKEIALKRLTLMLLVAYLPNTKKKKKNYWNPGKWVLIWEYSARAIQSFQWIPTWQSLDVFQKCLHPHALNESSLSIWRVKNEGDWVEEIDTLIPAEV